VRIEQGLEWSVGHCYDPCGAGEALDVA